MAISMKLPAEIKRMGRIFGLYYLGSVGGTFLGMFMVTFNDGIHSSASEIEQVLGPFIFPIMAVLWIPFVPIMALPTYRFLVEDRAMIVACVASDIGLVLIAIAVFCYEDWTCKRNRLLEYGLIAFGFIFSFTLYASNIVAFVGSQ